MTRESGNPAGSGITRTDHWILLFLFLLFSSLYFATASGITSSNDGSHYALLRTIIHNGHFTLDQFACFTENNDVAVRGRRVFSDRPPGTALAGIPFYAAGYLLPPPIKPLPTHTDQGNPNLLYLLLLPVFAGTGTLLILFLLLRSFTLSPSTALVTTLATGIGTIHWKYASVFFSHSLASFLVAACILLLLRIIRGKGASYGSLILLGFLSGYCVLVEYASIILTLYLLVVLLLWARTYHRVVPALASFVAGGVPAALFLVIYNTLNFGGPLTLSYHYALNYPWAHTVGSIFVFPLFKGLFALLVWGSMTFGDKVVYYNQGIFLLSPILLLALPGFYFYFRARRREAIVTTLPFLLLLLIISKHFTMHGFTGDSRYLVPYLWLLALPVGFLFERIWQIRNDNPLKAPALFCFFGLTFLSLRNVFYHIALSFNYSLDLTHLNKLVTVPGNWAYLLESVFRNTANLPLLYLVEGIAALILLLPALLRRFRRDVGSTGF